MPLVVGIIGGILFLAFMALCVWLYLRSMNLRKPKHITEAYPFFKRAFAEGKPTLWICLGVVCLLTSLGFFFAI
jgi:hypothetical protein